MLCVAQLDLKKKLVDGKITQEQYDIRQQLFLQSFLENFEDKKLKTDKKLRNIILEFGIATNTWVHHFNKFTNEKLNKFLMPPVDSLKCQVITVGL